MQVEIIYWKDEDWTADIEFLTYKDAVSNVYISRILERYSELIPELNSVEIETVNRCNNDCGFCPVSFKNEQREYCKMKEELFRKIIDELSELDYRGYISLFSNNEPLLDNRIIDFLCYAKKKLPNAKHAMYTNGILLTEEKYRALIQKLDYLVIDNYNDDYKINPNIQELMELEISKEIKCHVRVEVRKKHQVLSNRGGIAPNKEASGKFNSGCILPFFQMVIRPDGKISRCCQDAYGRTTLADLNESSLRDAWNNSIYKNFRNGMIKKGRECDKACVHCDVFGLGNYFPRYWIHEYTECFFDILWKQKEEGKRLAIVGGQEEVAEIIELMWMHGLTTDEITEEIRHVDLDTFYIMSSYDVNLLKKLKPDGAGKNYIVFENPNLFLLQDRQLVETGYSIKKMFELIKKAENENRLLIFGAGKNCIKLIEKYDFKVRGFIDNNIERQGTEYFGKTIFSPEQIQKNDLVLVAANDYKAISGQLKKFDIDVEQILNGNRLL